MALQTTPGPALQPSQEQVALQTNYITNFDFLSQYLPDVYDKEFARYGDRSVASFIRRMSAEIPSNSDLIKWSEEGRLHTKYVDCTTTAIATDDVATFVINDTLLPGNGGIALRKGQTVIITQNSNGAQDKAIITDVDLTAGEIDVAYYAAGGQTVTAAAECTIFIYGSEFKKGTTGMEGSLVAETNIFENSPIIMKDRFAVNGSDMAQIGWILVEGKGAMDGYYWYLKSMNDNRMRFDDYLETSMIEAVPAGAGSGVATQTTYANAGNKGTEGVFFSVEDRGNVWLSGNPTAMSDWDTVIGRLDAQGAIQENAIFLNRSFAIDTDDMLAAQNNSGPGGTSYGLFNNDKEMALNLGFVGWTRGSYNFYKSDWKYLNEITMRGGLPAGVGRVNGLMVPGGTKSVKDNVSGKTITMPFLHVRYRASSEENRKYKTWITGSAGGASTSDLDAMEIHQLTERCICTLGANNFFIFKG